MVLAFVVLLQKSGAALAMHASAVRNDDIEKTHSNSMANVFSSNTIKVGQQPPSTVSKHIPRQHRHQDSSVTDIVSPRSSAEDSIKDSHAPVLQTASDLRESAGTSDELIVEANSFK